MYELVQVAPQTYYIESPAKMGLYRLNEREVCLIDSGNDKDAGKKVQNILTEKGWSLNLILNTHSNADHIGGNALLQQRLKTPVTTSALEGCFTRFPQLEPSFLYGGYPAAPLRNKFLMAQPSRVQELESVQLPQGLQTLPLPGHFFDMFAVHSDDQVWFLADCLMGEAILNKYHISFIYDVAAYLKTLEVVEQLSGEWFIPAHAPATKDIRPLVVANRAKVLEIIERLLIICRQPQTADEILKQIFDAYQLSLDWNQYVLVGSTIRSYLSYLLDQSRLLVEFKENRLLWLAA